MKKVQIPQKSQESTKFDFNGVQIEVIPYITSNTQQALIEAYLGAYFQDGEDRLGAELVNKKLVLELLTNVELDEQKILEEIENVIHSGLWEKIEKAIRNFREYSYNLSIALDYKKKQQSDIGYILKQLIEEKIYPLIEKFGNMNFSDEKLAEMKGLVGEIGKQLSPDTPVGSLINKGVV